MHAFEQLSETARVAPIEKRENTTFLASRETLGFENIEYELGQPKLPDRFELPPPKISRDELATALASQVLGKEVTWKSRWTAFMVLAYQRGARIFFTPIGPKVFAARVEFQKHPHGK